MRLQVVVLLLVSGCSANTAPSPPYGVSATREPTELPSVEPAEEPTPDPQARAEPVVVAQGFTADIESDAASYAVVIANPNATWVPRFVDVSITFLDTVGAVLTTETQTITGIRPESETAVAGEALEAGGATEMEVQISNLNLLPTGIRSSLAETGTYEYEGIQTAPAASGGIGTTGLVLSRFESEQVNVPIHVVYYNAAGEVVGGAVTSVDHVPPGGQAAFETRAVASLHDVAETRIFGHIGFGS